MRSDKPFWFQACFSCTLGHNQGLVQEASVDIYLKTYTCSSCKVLGSLLHPS